LTHDWAPVAACVYPGIQTQIYDPVVEMHWEFGNEEQFVGGLQLLIVFPVTDNKLHFSFFKINLQIASTRNTGLLSRLVVFAGAKS